MHKSSEYFKLVMNANNMYTVSKKIGPLRSIWYYFTNSQRSQISFGTGRPYSILSSRS